MSNKKQTAVDLAFEYFDSISSYVSEEKAKEFNDKKAELKELEKQQMIDFGFDTYCFISGIMKVPFEQLSENKLNAEHNYKETYGE